MFQINRTRVKLFKGKTNSLVKQLVQHVNIYSVVDCWRQVSAGISYNFLIQNNVNWNANVRTDTVLN